MVLTGIVVPDFFTPEILQDVDPALWHVHRFGLSQVRWEQLYGKRFWVIGAGTGYGRCIAVALSAAGARVFLSGRRYEKLNETLAEGKKLGVDVSHCVPLPLDMNVEEELVRGANFINSATKHLYGVVHCAALPQAKVGPHPLIDEDLASWTNLLRTNVTGPWLASKVALPILDKGDGFRMIFLSSEAGWATTPGFGPYNVSKSALNTLGVSLAAECAVRYPNKDVQINVLVPGEARTEMNQGSTQSPYSIVSMALTLLSNPLGGPNGFFFHRDGRHLSFAYSSAYPRSLNTL